jgi:hypothetical protein
MRVTIRVFSTSFSAVSRNILSLQKIFLTPVPGFLGRRAARMLKIARQFGRPGNGGRVFPPAAGFFDLLF